MLGKEKDETKKQELINRMWDEGVLTDKSNGVAQYIEDNFGINVWKYTGKGRGGGGKKPKKFSIKVTPIKISIPKSKTITVRKPRRKKLVKRRLKKVKRII